MELHHQANFKEKETQKKVFDNSLIQAMSRTPIWAPISLFFLISGGLLYWAIQERSLSIAWVAFLYVGGWLFFTLLEYCMHRFLFHMKITSNFRKNVQYGFHGVHHDFPKDKQRLAMPIPLSLTFCVVFFALFWLVMQENTYGFLPGVLCGYATYLFVHFIVHCYAPPNNIFRSLWVNHAIHHYKDDSVVFGVSSQLWDHIFRTMPKK